MKLKQKRIRGTKKLLSSIDEAKRFLLGTYISDNIKNVITSKFNLSKIELGHTLFPSPLFGIMSKRNAVGEYISQKDKPKETAYRALEWELKDYGGHTHSGINYVPYRRYPRKFIEPKELRLKIVESEDKKFLIVVDKIFDNTSKSEDIIFAANLFLEIFEEVEAFDIYNDSLLIKTPIVETVNWEILPKGERIWESFNKNITDIVSSSEQTLIKERFEFIEQYKPDSARQGIGGYTGYIIFEFRKENIYIFDSIIYGDATYIFENDWEKVSKLSKKEIIKNNLARERIVHNRNWKQNISRYLHG